LVLGAAWLATPPVRAAVFDYSAPLQAVSATPGAGVMTLEVFDPARGLVATNVATGSTFDLKNVQGVVTWSSGGFVYYFTYDPLRASWRGEAAGTGTPFDLNTLEGVVAWSVQSGGNAAVYYLVYDRTVGQWRGGSAASRTTSNLSRNNGVVAWSTSDGVYYRAYDVTRGNWFGAFAAGSTSDLTSTNGVLAWSSGGFVNCVTYDPTRTGWVGTSGAGSTFDLKNVNGVVAWSSSQTVRCRVYDPARGLWQGTDVNSGGAVNNLQATNGTVTWLGGATFFRRGYDPVPGVWTNSFSRPLAYFTVSTNRGNAPLPVYFIDLSIGATNWNWNFGDGTPVSALRSPLHTYTAFGGFQAVLTVAGVFGNSSTNRLIATDTIPPAGTVAINGGAAFTVTNAVTLNLAATDNSGVVASNRFSNDGTSWSPWENYTTAKAWTLTTGDGNKTVFVQFSDAAANATNASDTILLDTRPPPVLTLVNTNVVESAGTVTVLARLSTTFLRPVSANYVTADDTALDGLDYFGTNGLLYFPAGVTEASLTVAIRPDTLVELHETFNVLLFNPTNAVLAGPGAVTILDDDLPTIGFTSTNFSTVENAGEAVVSVRLNAASGLQVSARFAVTNGTATNGLDFSATNGLLVFLPGQTNRSFTVSLLNDAADEFPETVLLSLSSLTNAVGGVTNATLTILDDDLPAVRFASPAYTVDEPAGQVIVQLRLTKPYFENVDVDYETVPGTALPGTDYFGVIDSVRFLPGQTNRNVLINLTPDDMGAEPDKAFEVRITGILGAVAGSPTNTTVNILDDDGAPRFTDPRVTNGVFHATLRGRAGIRFSVEAAENLGNWMAIGDYTNATGQFQFTDPGTTNRPRRFYRTMRLGP
jgi:hypothetical protein